MLLGSIALGFGGSLVPPGGIGSIAGYDKSLMPPGGIGSTAGFLVSLGGCGKQIEKSIVGRKLG